VGIEQQRHAKNTNQQEEGLFSGKESQGSSFMFDVSVYHPAVKCVVVTTLVDWIVNNSDAEKLTKENRWHF